MLRFQPPEMNFGQTGIFNKLKLLTLFKQSCFVLFSYLFFCRVLFVVCWGFKIIIPIKGLWSRWVLQNYKWIAYRISDFDCKCTWHFEKKTRPVLLRSRFLLSLTGGVKLGYCSCRIYSKCCSALWSHKTIISVQTDSIFY